MACVTIRRRVKISSLVALLLYIGLCKDRHGKNKVREAVGRAWKVLNGEDEMRGEEVEGVPSSPRPSRDEAWVERTVDDVLRFWFNHGSRKMRNLNRELWMCQGEANVKKADDEVWEKFGDVVDALVLDEVMRDAWFEVGLGRGGGETGRRWVAGIVILDQFARHTVRRREREGESGGWTLKRSDELALKYSGTMVKGFEVGGGVGGDAGWCCISDPSLTAEMKIFAAMPFRHSGKLELGRRCLEMSEEWDKMLEEESENVVRFRKATLRRVQGEEDKRRHGNHSKSTLSDSDLLEESGFTVEDWSGVEEDVVYQDMERWLIDTNPDVVGRRGGRKKWKWKGKGKNGGGGSEWGGGHKWRKAKSLENSFTSGSGTSSSAAPPPSKVGALVSLSGGVDSMVIAQVLVLLASRYPITVTAVHIEYGNRQESAAECDFVKRWCEDRGIEFVKRRIDEVRRGVTDRDEYEKIAREIRYGTYRDVIEGSEGSIKGVVFGHHAGDVVENVISNAMKGKGVLDLSGMGRRGVINGVTVERPLIDLEKVDILAFARKWGVPYFNDTTPSWSTRGKMRGTVIPTLEDVFGVGVQKVLLGLANQSNECRDMVEEDTVGAVLSTASFSQGGTHFSLSSYRSRSSFFYRTVLQSVLHNTGLPMISLKAIGTLMKHLSLEDIGDRWLQLKPDYGTFLRADGRIFVFKSSAFVWGKRQGKWREDNEGFRIGVGGEGRVGEWILSTEVVHGSVGDGCGVEDAKEMVKRKPFGDFEDLLEGRFEYCVIVKTKKRASVDGSGVVPIIATRGSSASLSPPRKYSGMNGSPLSLSSRSSEEDLKREEDFFPSLRLSPPTSKPLAFRGVHVKILSSLPIVDVLNRVELDIDEWDEDNFNYSVVKVKGVLGEEGRRGSVVLDHYS